MKPGWTEAALGEIAEVRLGRQRSPKNHSGIQMRPYVRAANIGWGGLRLDDVKVMNFTNAEMSTYKLAPGDLLLGEASGSASEVGKPAIWNGEIEDCGFQNTLLRVRSSGPEPRYLLHFFRHQAVSGGFARRSRGVGIFHLGRKALAEMPIPLPPLEEQKRIAAILDKADELQTKRRAAIAHLDSLTEAIFLDMFGDPLANPRGWPVDGLGDLLVELQYGPRFYDDSYSETGVPIVRITDLNDAGDLDFSAMPRMDLPAATRSKYVLRHGDLLFARSGATVGKVALVRPADPECIAGAYFMVLRPKPEVESTYLWSYLRSESVRATITTRSRQAAQQNFSGPAIRRLSVPVPPRELQARFGCRLTKVQRALDQHRSALAQADSLALSLRARAFRGEL